MQWPAVMPNDLLTMCWPFELALEIISLNNICRYSSHKCSKLQTFQSYSIRRCGGMIGGYMKMEQRQKVVSY